mmetsp:Transcript_37216/g.105845  ORF Transcript_37216/g.105845 Transcript_37216/m.105845 type:complete len:217 (+) Transcript_37216:86-736(+)
MSLDSCSSWRILASKSSILFRLRTISLANSSPRSFSVSKLPPAALAVAPPFCASSTSFRHSAFFSSASSSCCSSSLVSRRNSSVIASAARCSCSPFFCTMAKCSRNCSSSAWSNMLVFGGDPFGERSVRDPGGAGAPLCLSATNLRKCSSSSNCTSWAIVSSRTARSSESIRAPSNSWQSLDNSAHSPSNCCNSSRCLLRSSLSAKVVVEGTGVEV